MMDDAQKIILELLLKQDATTGEVVMHLEKHGSKCPDDVVRLLNKMKKNGLIDGIRVDDNTLWLWTIKRTKR